MSILGRIAAEPPFRLATYYFVKRFAHSVRTIDRWGAVARPNYLAGVLAAADQAKRQQQRAISVIEFGVAGGSGLVALQESADAVERDTGISVSVWGFDTGEGLPEPLHDYRDHPDQWIAADYKMDVTKLRARLASRTTLVLGPISETLPKWLENKTHAPVGFISCDVDLYSSTNDVLQVFGPRRRMLHRAFIYFDDINFVFNHRFAGELLAVDEFNRRNDLVKIDRWRGIKKGRVFDTDPWLESMYVAHDLVAINACAPERAPSEGCALV